MAVTNTILLHLFPLLLLVPFRSVLVVAQLSNNISLGSSILASSDLSSWKSPLGDFAFGFHRLDNQDLFLPAIWFDKIPQKTLVWYANGDSPVTEGSKIELSLDGQFTLKDPQGQVLWKAESSDVGVAYAVLLDTGNLVLAKNDSSRVWESFKNPTDTILPTQVLEIGGKLSSKKAENDYAKGRFQLRLLEGNMVLNTISLPTEYAYDPYYRSNTVDRNDSMNSGYQVGFNESGYLQVVLRNRNIVNLTSGDIVPAKDFYYRATLDFDGVFTQYAHPKSQINGSWARSWFMVWYAPKDICSDLQGEYGEGACGFNSYCILDSSGRPTCRCLPGFSLKDPGNRYSGCDQDIVPQCKPGSGSEVEELFEMYTLVSTYWTFSANYERLDPATESECSRSCLYDCNCVVSNYRNGACWKKKLPLTNGRMDRSVAGKAFVKTPKNGTFLGDPFGHNPNSGQKSRGTIILVVSILLGTSVFLNALFMAARSTHKRQKLVPASSAFEMNIRSFTYENLKEATEAFKEEIGRGAFGIVYKGVLSSLSSKTHIAVKKLDKLTQERNDEFKREVTVIAKTHHKNLVRLLGFCDEEPHKLLVYEFMQNGTLAGSLFGSSRPNWNKRIEMAHGIARGLLYLHEECDTQIIHCDIKPQNILLDDSFTARISDFGLAKLLMTDQTQTLTAIRGTKGYVAPEWFRNTPITAKVDVYSYGVMLLEILFCRKSLEMERQNEEEVILTEWVYDCYKERRLEKLLENNEEERNNMERLEKIVMIAIWCIQEDPSLRPSMRIITLMLEGVVQVPVPPCPSPSFGY